MQFAALQIERGVVRLPGDFLRQRGEAHVQVPVGRRGEWPGQQENAASEHRACAAEPGLNFGHDGPSLTHIILPEEAKLDGLAAI